MTRREWMEKHFGRRPSTMTLAALAVRVKNLRGLLASAEKTCHATERWDAIDDAIRRFIASGQDRPGDT